MAQIPLFLKLRAVKLKLIAFIILFFGVSFMSYILIEKWYKNSQKDQKITHIEQKWNMTFQYIVVHFDLKGAPPLLTYLQSTLKTLKDRGTTALLIEYEDMFPYEGVLVNLTARNRYDRNELKQFLMSADKIGLEVIPLVQTFGQLEFALKLREFQHLREEPIFPDSICPSKKESQDFLREMLRQVIKFHSNITPLKHIHIGFNEVHQIKVCKLCSRKRSSKMGIILEHIKFISHVIEDFSPKTKILVWDDIFRYIQPGESINLRFPNIEIVCSDYTTTNLDTLHPSLHKYQRIFGNQWVATAYKGADGPTRTIPDLKNRFLNHLNWLNFIMNYDCLYNHYDFKGIILTGRSRYSHMEPPCELLPVAMPSLVLNLILIEKYHNGIVFFNYEKVIKTAEDYERNQMEYINYFITDDLNSALMCQNSVLDGSLETFQAMACIFEGSDLYVILTRYSEARIMYTATFFGGHDTNFSSDINSNEMQQGYIKMNHVKNLLDMSVGAMQELIMVESQLIDSMTPYFDKYAIEEYVILKVSKMKKNLHDLMQFLNDYYVVRDWPRRPSNYMISASYQDGVGKEKQSIPKRV